jgi:hypothetical protein
VSQARCESRFLTHAESRCSNCAYGCLQVPVRLSSWLFVSDHGELFDLSIPAVAVAFRAAQLAITFLSIVIN